MNRIWFAGALLLITTAAQAQTTLLDKLLGILSGSTNYSYTFDGWAYCDDEHVLGGCTTTRTGYRVKRALYFKLSSYECLGYIQAAKSLGSDGICF